MSVLSAILAPETRASKQTIGPPWSQDPALISMFGGGGESSTGIVVDEKTALSDTAVLCAIRNLSESVAMLPIHMYQRSGKSRERAIEHTLYSILHDEPNGEMTDVEFKEFVMAQMLTRGNSYSWIERAGNGQIVGIWPLMAQRMKLERDKGVLVYVYNHPDGKIQAFIPRDIMHIRGFSLDGLMGLVLHHVAADTIGISIALRQFLGRLFSNGMLAGSYLSHPQSLSEPAQERLRKSFEAKYAGIDKAHRLMVLEEGMKLDQIGVSPEDAQALEGRRFQVNEVSRIFNIAPHRLFELSHATFSNIEHQGLEYVTYTLTPWLTRIEKRLRKDLLSSTEKATFYFEFLADALLRGDLKSMNEAMQIEYQNGWLTADEARQIKNRNPLPDGLGEKHYRPANLFEIGMEPPPPDPAMAGAAPTQGAMV